MNQTGGTKSRFNASFMEDNFSSVFEFGDAVIKSLPYGIMIIDIEGSIMNCNELALKNLGLNPTTSEAIHRNVFEYLDEFPVFKKVLENRLIKDQKAFDLRSIFFHEKHLRIQGNGLPNGMVLTIEDVTQRKKQARINLNAVLEGQENERRRLAREIHDGVGPVMSIIKLHLDAVKSELKEVPEPVMKKINSMSELIHEVSESIRDISHDLMPSALTDFGLVAALENLCRKANESEKIHVRFYHSGMKNQPDSQIALSIFRITQELLNNAFKYSDAQTITIQLIRHPESIILMVEDDGTGFDKSELNLLLEKGIGIRNIQTRTAAVCGLFNLDTQKGRGVLATLEIPLKN